jgi:hypothetical protein
MWTLLLLLLLLWRLVEKAYMCWCVLLVTAAIPCYSA